LVTVWRDRRGRGALGCLGSLVVLALLIYAGFIFGPPWLRYQQFRDEMKTEARFSISLPDSVIRARLAVRADSLRLPAAARRVTIVRRGGSPPTITISAAYDEHLHLLFLGERTLHFKPTVEATD